MSTRKDIKQRFKELESRIEGLVQRICPCDQPRSAQNSSSEPSATRNPSDSSSLLHNSWTGSSSRDAGIQLTLPRSSDLAETTPEIRIPGIAPLSRSLITPVAQSDSYLPDCSITPKVGSSDATDEALAELVAVLEAPLVATGQLEPKMLKVLSSQSAHSWTHWWIDIGEGHNDAQSVIATRFIGPWFGSAVVGNASLVLVGGTNGYLSDLEFQRVVQPYVVPSYQSTISAESSWHTLLAIVGVLAGRGPVSASSASALTLALKLLDNVVSLGQLDPRQALSRIGCTGHATIDVKSKWTEYMQIACTLPERVANSVDPHSVPHALLPRPYFSRLAMATVECCTASAALELVVDLCAKLCRVGQIELLCAELAAALATSASTIVTTKVKSTDGTQRLLLLGRFMSQIPVPFRTRVISGTIGQLDLMGAGYFGANSQCSAAERIQFNYQLVLIICIVAHSILDSSAATAAMTDEVVSGLILRADGAGGGAIVRPSSISTLQAIGLSLQLLSGKYQAPTSLDMPLVMSELYQQLLDALPKRIFPSLLTDALVRVIIPTWSFSDTVAHARMEDIKPLTALILMCTGALSTKECTELSMGAEFSRAIPQFLDAPTPLVRLSGIIVADCIVSSAHLAKRNTATQEGDGSDKAIDFGLDEIIRDAQTTTQPIIKASADYILETRRFAHPIEQQWAEANNCAADNSSRDSNAESSCKGEATAEAISFMRAYNGIDGAADSSAVYAPRQSSLTAEPDLSSRFVKPRAPVFLRDCLGYLKSQKDDSTERAQIGLYALANCIEKSNIKTVEELWLLVANKVLYMYNRGPEDLDWAWDMERRKSLVALTIKLPELLGPFLADRSCDRNLTLKDREIVFSAIATACLQLAGLEVPHALSAKQGSAQAGIVEVAPQEHANTDVDKAGENMGTSALVGAGTVVRRSRRLDLVAAKSSSSSASGAASGHLQAAQRKYASIVGPAFFFPLISQYGKSDMSTAISDIRDDASQLERYINTLAVMLYTGGSASHQITMNREFWDLAKLVRCIPGAKHVNESPPVLDALLFGIDVILSPERALSTPTLAREFRADIADMVQWINGLAEQGILGQSAMVHAARIVSRLQEIQGDVYRRATSNDINKFTSLF